MLHRLAALWAVFLLLLPVSAHAQGAAQLVGSFTKGHLVMYVGNGQLMDAGGPTTAGGSPANSVNPGVLPNGAAFVNSGQGVALYSGYASAAYSEFKLGFDGAGNGLMTIDRVGGGPNPSFGLSLNGTLYPFPGTGNGNVLGPGSASDGAMTLFNGGGGALIKSGITSGDPGLVAYTPPGFGGTWLTTGVLSTTGTAGHGGSSRATANINRTTIGSGLNGPGSSDIALSLTMSKTNWLTSVVDGEIDPIYIVSRQGLNGDGSGILADVAKVRGGTAGMVGYEAAVQWTDSSGNNIMQVHPISGYAPATGEISNNTGHGFYASNFGPSVAGAASMVDPYSAFTSADLDNYGNCPTHCSFFQNFLVASVGLNQPALTYFRVTGGSTVAGDIIQGSGGSVLYGVPSQSLGHQITYKNVGGAAQLVANDGTTIFKQTLQSIAGGGVVERLNGPTPSTWWRDTGVAVTAGGLQRISFTAGKGVWQINTAAGADFSTKLDAISVSAAGAVVVGTPTPGADTAGSFNAVLYEASGVSGVSCAANTVVLTTFAVTNGIVTHC